METAPSSWKHFQDQQRAHKFPILDFSYNFPIQVFKTSQKNQGNPDKETRNASDKALRHPQVLQEEQTASLDTETAPSAVTAHSTTQLHSIPSGFIPRIENWLEIHTIYPKKKVLMPSISLYFKYLSPLPCLGRLLFTTEVTGRLTPTRRGCSGLNLSTKKRYFYFLLLHRGIFNTHL